ncbi:FAD dependent oxidoreductase superfamily protein [Xylariaceae sp. FL0255]|nr:FAD dependent oxidoreductase superfamily protein [Xylariaceae sp. FL0255]
MSSPQTENAYLPVSNYTKPYWRSELHHLDSHRSTPELPETCDILIIGAGMSGVSLAYHIGQQTIQNEKPSIVLLEARQICSGATGRNGGHVKIQTGPLLESGRNPSITEKMTALVQAHIDALHDVVQAEKLDCEFELRRSYDTFTDEADAARYRKAWEEHAAKGEGWMRGRQMLQGELAAAVTGVKGVKLAFSSPACSLWPYKFVTQLLERAMSRNANLNVQTETPVLSVENDADGESLVHTARGTIRAKKVVFATNGYTIGLLPQYKGTITPYKGTCAHLAPPAGRDPVFPHLSHTYNLDWRSKIEYEGSAETVDYFNPRPDGGIVVGGANWLYAERRELWWNNVDDSTLFDAVMDAKYFEGYMQRNFRGWEDSGTVVNKVWTGIQAETPDSLPHAGEVPNRRNQWIMAGYNGGGMPIIFLLAKGMAQMVQNGVVFENLDPVIPRAFKTTKSRMSN